MNHRFLSTLGALAAMIAMTLLVVMPAAAQTTAKPASAVKNWTPPKTADGQPDISGVFSSATSIPVQRPANLGAKEFYTEEEYTKVSATRRPAAAEPGEGGAALAVHYDVSQFGLDRSHAKVAQSLRTSIITGPEGRVPPLTAEAQKRGQERQAYNRVHQWDGPETRPYGERCIMWPAEGPPMMPEGYNSNLQITQGPGYVVVLQEMIHNVRVIPLDGRPHLSGPGQFFGDSRGHWEGNTLVVETTNFDGRLMVQNAMVTNKMKVIERFTRADPETVVYSFTVDDPATWTKPWSGEYAMTKINSPIYEYACSEGNYGMANNLSGARAEEKKAAAGK